jgi:hypothetical protein
MRRQAGQIALGVSESIRKIINQQDLKVLQKVLEFPAE